MIAIIIFKILYNEHHWPQVHKLQQANHRAGRNKVHQLRGAPLAFTGEILSWTWGQCESIATTIIKIMATSVKTMTTIIKILTAIVQDHYFPSVSSAPFVRKVWLVEAS